MEICVRYKIWNLTIKDINSLHEQIIQNLDFWISKHIPKHPGGFWSLLVFLFINWWGELVFHGLTNLRLSLKSPFSGWTVLERTTQEFRKALVCCSSSVHCVDIEHPKLNYFDNLIKLDNICNVLGKFWSIYIGKCALFGWYTKFCFAKVHYKATW